MMVGPTETLREEHRVILRALDALEAASERLAAGGALPAGWWGDLLEWLRAFADRSHHAKEERCLFPAMERAGLPFEGGPIDVMLEEHTEGRGLIQAMEGGDPARRPEMALRYVRLLRDHIDKENEVLFAIADSVLDEPARRDVARGFGAVEAEQGRTASIEDAEARLGRLVAALG
jgi:hemerythrin-like domain-containing protein